MLRKCAAVAGSVLLLSGTPAAAQDDDPRRAHQTVARADARFEVLHADGIGETMRLDKITGEVWLLHQSTTKFPGPRRVWEPITPPPSDDPATSNRLKFQLFAPRHSAPILLNVDTGESWVLRHVPREYRWEPLTNEK